VLRGSSPRLALFSFSIFFYSDCVGYDILEWVWPTLLAWVINPRIFLVAIWLISYSDNYNKIINE